MAHRVTMFAKSALRRALGLQEPPTTPSDGFSVERELSDYIIEVIRENAAEVEAILAARRSQR